MKCKIDVSELLNDYYGSMMEYLSGFDYEEEIDRHYSMRDKVFYNDDEESQWTDMNQFGILAAEVADVELSRDTEESKICALIDHDHKDTTYIVAKCVNGRWGLCEALKKIKEMLDSDIPYWPLTGEPGDPPLKGTSMVRF